MVDSDNVEGGMDHQFQEETSGGREGDKEVKLEGSDLPPMYVPPVMLVRQAWGQGRQARGPQAPAAGSPASCAA